MYRKYFTHLHSNLPQTVKFNLRNLLTQTNQSVIPKRLALNVELLGKKAPVAN